MIALAPLASAVTMELVARRMSKTTHTVWLKSRSFRAANSAGLNRTSRVLMDLFRSHVMEKVLLGEACIWSEMRGRKLVQASSRGSTARKVKLPERFHDPNIHGKGGREAVGEQQD